MKDEDIKHWRDLLEVGPTASLQEIKNSYIRLRKLYGGGSIVLEPLQEEFTESRRMKILVEIEEAYEKLLELHKGRNAPPGPAARPGEKAPAKPGSPEAEEPPPPPLEERTLSGPALRRVRERLGIELIEISNQLKLRTDLLRAIEDERFEALPEEIYLKTHVKNIATFLNLKPGKAVEDYLARYREWKRTR